MSEIVDLSKLPAPKVLEELDYETLLAERKAKFLSLYPESERSVMAARLALESEPITKLLQENCYLQLLERQRINSAAQATMLAYATGTDLDVIGGNYNVARKVIQTEDLTARPPKQEILEQDEDFRLRIQLAFEGLSVAGPRNAYIFHALSAHEKVADVSVSSPTPASVLVTVMSSDNNGIPTSDILQAVRNRLNDEDIRPIGDRVTVQACTNSNYQIRAKLHLYRGPEIEPIKQVATEKIGQYVKEKRRLGRDISLSGIYSALHLEGVQRVELLEPTADIVLNSTQAGLCTNITIETVISNDY
ncbi:TPA: baseplate assembly protein [Mannheimia haemolytica]|uniref:baseplate assembly protein n=1 Tax=Mannheimia haemolytica TaxID=75985 RepID=UPI0001BCFE21|nr:baseplate assembly protein [Mannheimia haemolytica]EEY10971.1 baseplate assembly protein J [Mannheimia haemolytica serotype A2 str. OVINE]HDL3366332.1 baseplate assembly protein [Mannheimia haemolytica]HDZ6746381.1 baseplate assembly protein [Mannheimia haemolytica]HDZ6812220.1 baseplate assembly protein [Mannheimia haemolytica]